MHGFNEDELVKVYKTVVRPYHSMMADGEDEMIERLQAQALKCIFGWRYSYEALRRRAGVPTLCQRRINLADSFAEKCAASQRFGEWFPRKALLRPTRSAQNTGKYQKAFARCERLRNSPLHYMRRRLNGGAGKSYEERNKFYRDTEGDGITLVHPSTNSGWRVGRVEEARD